MKYIILLLTLAIAGELVQQKVDFMTENNPVLKVSRSLNRRIFVGGVIHTIKVENNNRILILGRLGKQAKPPKYSTNLTVVIFQQDMAKFKNDNDSSIVDSYAIISGVVIHYHGKVALRLRNRDDLDFTSAFPKSLVIR